MATSGVSAFTYNRNQIIRSALRKCGAISSGETPDAQMVSDCSDQLNLMIKAWDSSGLHIWTETEATLFLQTGQVAYTLGGNTPDHATEAFTQTTLSAMASGTSIAVTAATGFVSGYNVGVTLDSGTVFWTTQSGAPSGTTITLAAPVPSQASAGAIVFVYQTNIIRPLRIVAGRRYVYNSAIDTPMIPMSRLDYRNLPNKTSQGTITQFFYDPRGGANAQGIVYVWPAPSDSASALKFTWWRPMQDFLTAADNPDLPIEWVDTIIWNLAFKMAPEFDVPPQRFEMLKLEAGLSMDLASGFDREPESVYFGVNFDQR